MNESLIKEFRNFKEVQMFVSDTFDDLNRNWCLFIVPKGTKFDVIPNEQTVTVALQLLRRPKDIESFIVEIMMIKFLLKKLNLVQDQKYDI